MQGFKITATVNGKKRRVTTVADDAESAQSWAERGFEFDAQQAHWRQYQYTSIQPEFTVTIENVTVANDDAALQRYHQREHWANLWQQAHNNMPVNPKNSGQAMALWLILGYNYRSPTNKGSFAGTSLRRAKFSGNKPKGDRAHKLQILAGPLGQGQAYNWLKTNHPELGYRLPQS